MKIPVLIVCMFFILSKRIDAKPPNILLVIADDYGWNDVGYHGSEIKTPTLDSLADEGVKLENYYVQPICTPTRSQLMSGRYQIHTGLQHDVIRPLVPNGLPLDIPTMADKLKELSYSTHIVGKWHLGYFKKEYMPTNRGFDSFFGYLNGAEDYYEHTRCEGYTDPSTHKQKMACGLDLRADLMPVRNLNGSYSAEIFANRVQDVVKQHAEKESEKPLFMYMPFQSVHAPLEVPERFTKVYSFIKNKARRQYAGMVSAMDEAIHNITEAFKKAGMWDNTIMIFSTDNGGQVHAGGNNYPLKGWKASLWEGGVRGVGFVRGNTLNKTGIVNHELIHVSDWFPTIINLAGGQTSGLKLDGYNVWNAISNDAKSPRQELLHNIDPLRPLRGKPLYKDTYDTRFRGAIRFGDWKLLTGDPGVNKAKHVKPPGETYNVPGYNSYKYRHCFNPYHDIDPYYECEDEIEPNNIDKNKNVWLYDIRQDPYEYKDVSDKYPAIVRKLLDRMAYYNSTAVPCRFPKPDPNSDPAKLGGVWGPWE